MGEKTVIQIGSPLGETPRQKLVYELEILTQEYDLLAKERDELSDELESIGDAASVKADREDLQRLEDAFDQIEQSVSTFAIDADIRPTTNEADNIDMLYAKYLELRNTITDLTDELGELKVDNRALASKIEDQDETIAYLEKELTNFTDVN